LRAIPTIMKTLSKAGYPVAVIGLALVLIWIGIFKFTPTEAKGIKGLMENSPLMAWMYHAFSVQAVSNIIGAFEIITGLLLVASFKWQKAGLIGGAMGVLTFLVTLSFLITTPGINATIDGVWIPDQFILKDLMALGICLMVSGRAYEARSN
jgi:uncharacterized membrane protein YkgB